VNKDLVLASESRCIWSNASSVRSPFVDEERMRPGHSLGLVLYVPFSALMLMVGWQEDFGPIKNPVPLTVKRFFSRTSGGGPEGEPANPGSPGKMALKWNWYWPRRAGVYIG